MNHEVISYSDCLLFFIVSTGTLDMLTLDDIFWTMLDLFDYRYVVLWQKINEGLEWVNKPDPNLTWRKFYVLHHLKPVNSVSWKDMTWLTLS